MRAVSRAVGAQVTHARRIPRRRINELREVMFRCAEEESVSEWESMFHLASPCGVGLSARRHTRLPSARYGFHPTLVKSPSRQESTNLVARRTSQARRLQTSETRLARNARNALKMNTDRSIRIEVVDPMADHVHESLAKHRKRNADLRQVLVGKGVNLSEQCPADIHFWAWSQRDASVLARELFKKGFLVKLLSPSPAPEDEDRWGIEAGALIVPDQILGDDFTEGMVRLAAQCEAVYDGWGTEV